MKWSAWLLRWAAVFAAAGAATGAAAVVIARNADRLAAAWTTLRYLSGLVGLAWIGWGLFGLLRISQGEQPRRIKLVQYLPQTLLIYPAVHLLHFAFSGQLEWRSNLAFAVGAMLMLGWLFVLGVDGVRAILSGGGSVLGVARAVLDEAIRMKVAVVFIALLLLVLPALPFALNESDPLRYRIQTFLNYSFIVTILMLSLMTIFLSCATLSYEIAEKQIYTVAVKPIGRAAYLAGKWLGIVMLNSVLLAVAGAAIYLFTVGYLARLPAKDLYDELAVRNEILTARVSQRSMPAVPFEQQAAERFQRLRAQGGDEALLSFGRLEAEDRGIGDVASRDLLLQLGADRAMREMLDQVELQYRSVGPMQRKTYVFTDLGRAKQFGSVVQFRYKITTSRAPPNQELDLMIEYNGRRYPWKTTVGQVQTIAVDHRFIDDNGTLAIGIINAHPQDPQFTFPVTITFPPDEGMEVLYQVDRFGPNYLRAMIVIWLKLAFLAMLGLTCATFLSFPVACLLALMVFTAASSSDFLLESIRSFGAGARDESPNPLWLVMNMMTDGMVTLLATYSRYKPTTQIVDGQLIGWGAVFGCLMWIGLIWTGLAGLIAAWVFRSRELARVQV